jgi:hypothetical protein
MWWAVILSVPVFYVIGLVSFIRWAGRNGRSPEQAARKAAAEELRRRAATQNAQVAHELLAVAESLEASPVWHPVPIGTESVPVPADTQPTPKVQPSAPKTDWMNQDVTKFLGTMDNINLLLFLGAFLIVVSAGIFVGYNFETLSGTAKVIFLAVFTAAFYFTGLALFLKAPKLRPAGTTFTGIGLVLLPFVGLAVYNFTSAHDQGSLVWLITSIVSFAFYVITLAVTRQTYIAYLMAFTTLSLFESTISLIQLPLYWMGWAASVVAIILMTLSRLKNWWNDAAYALTASAHVFIPVSLLFSLLQVGDHGLTQFGVTIALAGAFYGLLVLRHTRSPQADQYFAVMAGSLPAALGVGLWDHLARGAIVGLLVLVAVFYSYLIWSYSGKLSANRRNTLAFIVAALPVIAIPVDFHYAPVLWLTLLAVIALNAGLALYLRRTEFALIAELAALAVPPVWLFDVLVPSSTAGRLAAAYIVTSVILFGWRYLLRPITKPGDIVGVAGYLLALLAAVISAAASGNQPLLVVSLLVSAALFAASYYEQNRDFVYLAAASLYLASIQIVPIAHFYPGAYCTTLTVVGVIMYAVAITWKESNGRADALHVAGLVGPYAAAAFGFSGSLGLAPAISLGVAGLITMVQGYRRHLTYVMEIAGAVLLASFDWVLSIQNVTQTQVYTVPWAVYFAALAYRRRGGKQSDKDSFTILALATLTLPIAGQALSSTGQLYGLELILVGLGISIAGSSTRYRLLLWWGVATLVAEVLYQLRDYLDALPKYVISAALGLALLAAAIVLLQRKRQ